MRITRARVAFSFSAFLFAAAILLAVIVTAPPARGAITSIPASNVDAYFGSQNDGFQDRFPLSLPASWPAVGAGPYPLTSTYLIAGAPPPPGSLTPSNVTPFSGPGVINNFADVPGNSATSFMQAYIAAPGNSIDDAQIGMKMFINQIGLASYAYHQIDYDVDYALTNTPNSAGFVSGALPALVTRSYSVSGNVSGGSGSYAQFGGEMNFFSVSGGVPTALGTLNFSYLNTSPGASFATTVTSAATIGSIPINNPDFLRITGSFYVAGDPSSINVQSTTLLPEPATLGLLGLPAAASLLRRRRSKK